MGKTRSITDEFVRKKVASGKQYCLRLYKAGPNRNLPPAELEQNQAEHLRYLLQLQQEGILLINGPVINDPVLKGVSIFNTIDMEEVKRLSDEDPAVKVGRLVYELYRWFGLPGDCLPRE